MVERARAAAAADLDSLYVGDHHATPLPYYQNSPILGRLLAEWAARPGRIAGALYLLPLWHPVQVAEQVGTLAAISPVPFALQCAIGPDDNQFPALGVSARERRTRFEESLGVIRRLLAGEVVTQEGHWSLHEARVSPIPQEHCDVWIGAAAPVAIERAARLGDGWIAAPALPPETASSQLAHYRESCSKHDRTPRAVLRRDVFIAEDADAARARRQSVEESGHRGFPSSALVISDIESAAGEFQRFADMGFEEILVRNLVADQSEAIACIERLGEVKKRLR